MSNLWICVIALAVLGGCSREYDGYASSTSPDGKYITRLEPMPRYPPPSNQLYIYA